MREPPARAAAERLVYHGVMRWLTAALIASLAVAGCKSASSGQVAAAAISVGAAVAAAAINREITDECWGNCTHGTMCDRESGRCVPVPELARGHDDRTRWYPCEPTQFQCQPNEWLVCDEVQCEWYQCDESIEVCEPRLAPACSTPEECEVLLAHGPAPAARPPFAERASSDPCRGLCLTGERCVVQDGVADCLATPEASAEEAQ